MRNRLKVEILCSQFTIVSIYTTVNVSMQRIGENSVILRSKTDCVAQNQKSFEKHAVAQNMDLEEFLEGSRFVHLLYRRHFNFEFDFGGTEVDGMLLFCR